MNFFTQAAQRVRQSFAALSPRARWAVGGLAVLTLVGLVWLVRGGFGGGDTLLLGGRSFDAAEITAAQAAFSKAKLTEARIEGDRIRVPAEQEAAYVAAMADGGALPADFHDYLDETLSDIGPFVSGKQRDELIKNAKQRELANIIRRLPGVQAAAVHYDRQREPGLSRRETTTASVIVWPDASEPLDPRRLLTIRKLVASAIAGLKSEDVTVTDANGGELASEGGLDPAQNRYVAAMRLHQQQVRQQVLGVLGHISGLRLAINVEIDPQLDQTTERKEVNGHAPPNRAGTEVDVLPPPRAAPTEQVTQTRQVGLTPRRVTVAAAIPRGHFAAIWHSRNPGRKDETPPAEELVELESKEIATYEDLVRLAIPSGDDPDLAKLVKIAAYDQLDPPPTEQPATPGQPLVWLSQHWTTLAACAAAALALAMFALMFHAGRRKRLPPSDEIALDFGRNAQSAAEAGAGFAGPVLAGHTLASYSLEDELHDIIRKDPEAAANILKLWMADSA